MTNEKFNSIEFLIFAERMDRIGKDREVGIGELTLSADGSHLTIIYDCDDYYYSFVYRIPVEQVRALLNDTDSMTSPSSEAYSDG